MFTDCSLNVHWLFTECSLAVDKRYPLHTACAMGHRAIVQMLLDGGATAMVRDSKP
jgi:hypothetical protein